MKKTSRKGFTLIELLVVITIIGILATGAVTVYTSQIQKARDTTRISDISALRSGIEQFYQDDGAYPAPGAATFSGVTTYVPKLPTDPKSTQASTNSAFEYFYNASADSNGINLQEFEVSAHFENAGNIDKKAATDGGDDNFRIEFGLNVADIQHLTLVGSAVGSVANMNCVSSAGTAGACGPSNPMLIRSN